MDRLDGAGLGCSPAQFLFDGFVILLGSAVQPAGAGRGGGGDGGGRNDGVCDLSVGAAALTGRTGRGVPRLTVAGGVRQQCPAVVAVGV